MSPEYGFRVKANFKDDQEAENFKNLLDNLKGIEEVSLYDPATQLTNDEITKAATTLARRGASKGGKTTAANRTPEERIAAAKKAADARWHPQTP